MSMRPTTAAIVQSARTIELSRQAQVQSKDAIFRSLRLLDEPIFPKDRPREAEQ